MSTAGRAGGPRGRGAVGGDREAVRARRARYITAERHHNRQARARIANERPYDETAIAADDDPPPSRGR